MVRVSESAVELETDTRTNDGSSDALVQSALAIDSTHVPNGTGGGGAAIGGGPQRSDSKILHIQQ